ncbi:MAG TPA: hypothetical protein VLL54_18695 [Pyrinomonadaceae bacterium]|nr:hypothetical protein [Pyrinomonadaceae bacterium]
MGWPRRTSFCSSRLYLAIILGFAGVIVAVGRLLLETKTSSPSFLFFLTVIVFGFPAPLMVWIAESIIIRVLTEHSGIVQSAYTVNLLTIGAMIAAPFLILLLGAAALWPLSSDRARKWSAIVGMLTIELTLIFFAVAFQFRTAWLYEVRETGIVLKL